MRCPHGDHDLCLPDPEAYKATEPFTAVAGCCGGPVLFTPARPATVEIFDVPADLPAGGHEHYRRLIAEGFTLRGDRGWIAPEDVPPGHLSREQMVAVATLQEYGYGAVVNA